MKGRGDERGVVVACEVPTEWLRIEELNVLDFEPAMLATRRGFSRQTAVCQHVLAADVRRCSYLPVD